MTNFRPCIDLHAGKVKQIVGGTLKDGEGAETNFETDLSAAHFAKMYANDRLTGGHVIMLGPGNRDAALEALQAYPGGLQLGGGIRDSNAAEFLAAGARQIIVTSWLFDQNGVFLRDRLKKLAREVGAEQIVVDLSCRAVAPGEWVVAMNRWQTLTDLRLSAATLDELAEDCAEFLVHAADVEGKCQGMDEELIQVLGSWGGRPVTYAGGASGFDDLATVERLSDGNVDLTIGSALDIFGGSLVKYADCVAWNRREVT